VKRVWCVGPEVPNHVWIAQVGLRVSFLAVNKVRELHRVLNEEDGGVVAYHVVVTFFSIELNSEASGISDGVSGANFTSNC